MQYIYVFLALFSTLFCDEILDTLQSINDPQQFNSTIDNTAVRSIFINVVKQVSDSGQDKEVFVRLYSPLLSSSELATIASDQLAYVDLDPQFSEHSLKEIVRSGGVFVPVVLRFKSKQTSTNFQTGYKIQVSGINQSIDVDITSLSYESLKSVMVENNMHNQQIIATNPNRSQADSNTINENKNLNLFSNFLNYMKPWPIWYINNLIYFGKNIESPNLIIVDAGENEEKEIKFTLFISANALDNLAEGTYAYQLILSMKPIFMGNATEYIEEKTNDFENSKVQINYFTYSFSSLDGQLKDRNQLFNLSDTQIALMQIRQLEFLESRVDYTAAFVAQLVALKKTLPNTSEYTSFASTVSSLKDEQSRNLTIYRSELEAFKAQQSTVIRTLDKRIKSIVVQQKAEYELNVTNQSLAAKQLLNTTIINELTSLIKSVSSSIFTGRLSALNKAYFELQNLFLIEQLYREYVLKKTYLSEQIDQATKEQIEALIVEVQALANKPLVFTTLFNTLLDLFNNREKASIEQNITALNTSEKKLVLAITSSSSLTSLQTLTNTRRDSLITNVNSILDTKTQSDQVFEALKGKIEFSIGLREFYIQELARLVKMK